MKPHPFLIAAATVLNAANPEFKLVAPNQIVRDDSDFRASPAFAERHLFLRSNRNLFCIECMQPAGAK